MRPTATKETDYRVLLYFIVGWIIVNLLQASFTGLDGDEAYYWMFSRKLEWGYFDHPPLVALSIRMGEWFGHGTFFTRLFTVLFSAGAILFGYKALPAEIRDARYYILIFASVVMLNMYGFIVTPDSSLFFFTAFFFYAYRLYLKEEKAFHIILLALSITGLLYSKYHGVLPVFFTFLSNPKLVLRRSAWIIVIIVTIALIPHLVWQYQHDWPTVRYHLLERIGSAYKFDKTTNYIGGQLLIWGPFTTIAVLYLFLRRRENDLYLRAHYFTLWGIFLFFLLSSFRSTIEPHWTLTAGVSFIILFQQLLVRGTPKFRKIFIRLLTLNILFVIAARILFIIPSSPLANVKAFNSIFFGRQLSDSIYSYAAGTPVVFVNSYTQASLYQYYHPLESTTSYNTIPNRRNYFNLSGDEEKLNSKNVMIATGYEFGNRIASIKGFSDPMYIYRLDSFKSVNGLKLEWLNPIKKLKAASQINIRITLSNIAAYAVAGNKLYINYSFIKTRKEFQSSSDPVSITDQVLSPGYKKEFAIDLKMPIAPGSYRLIFSILQSPFAGTFASPFYDVDVD